jgi:hypothetical protein
VLELNHLEHRANAIRAHRWRKESNTECAVNPFRSGENSGASW